ncbi:MAG: hypothetical protein H6839_04415 [Planctomycetes bacterium]|nr:hypothetical protein [Planctomycetota bacterium]
MRKTLIGAAMLALLAGSLAAQDEEPVPGAKILERTKADAMLLLPQAGTGGSAKVRLEVDEQKQTEIKIDVEGCEKLKGYISTPFGLDKSKKYPLVLALNGDGLDTPEDLKSAARLSNGSDPLILASLMYCGAEDAGQGIRLISPLVKQEKLIEALTWFLKKVMADQPIDPDRVFLFGGRGGNDRAADWAEKLWEDDPDAFPFRACLYDGPMWNFDVEKAPPVATVFSVVDWDLEMSGGDSFDSPAKCANELLARGVPAEYHVFKADFFTSEPDRLFQIHRAAINRLGGPGAEEYPPDESRYLGAKVPADDIPWKEHKDPWANEVIAYALAEDWKGAWERGNGILNDKNIKTKEKRDLKDFMKEFEKYVKDECDRLDASIQKSIKADFWPNTWHWERLKAMNRAFKDESWYQKKGYSKTLETLKTYGPAQRDAARREKLMQAVKLELEGKRDEAKKIYQDVAKDKKEDGGVSTWPYAAEYRLSWWEDIG